MTTLIKTQTKTEQPNLKCQKLPTYRHVLVVENPQAHSPISELLLTLGKNYQLNICATVEEASVYIMQHKHTLDMIILDDLLPDARAIKLLSALHSNVNWKHILTVLKIDTYDAMGIKALTMATTHVSSLFSKEILCAIVEELLAKRSKNYTCVF